MRYLTFSQPEPIKNLNELVKAQLIYFSTAAEALSSVQGEIEELSVAAEGEYRSVKLSVIVMCRTKSQLLYFTLGSPGTTEIPLA